MSALVTGVTLAGVMSLSPSPHAATNVSAPASAATAASDRALLLTGLQRSWAKLNSTSRYKACWMWQNRPDLAVSGIATSFRGYGFSNADVYSVVRSHFNRVC
jgi:hypothetical protein